MASARVVASMLNTGGSLDTRRNRSGGSRVEDGLMVVWTEGGELGGVSRPWTGRGPGEL